MVIFKRNGTCQKNWCLITCMIRPCILILLLIVVGCLSATCLGQSADVACDYSSYKPFRFDHALFNAALLKDVPKYPAAAKAVKASGNVNVRILVNRSGRVVKACALDGHPLLRSAAEKSALKWKFKRKFGLSNPPRHKYIETIIVFGFKLDS